MCNVITFGLGAFSYGLIEILWRGYTHWSMMIAGGLSLLSFAAISDKFKNLRLLYKGILGGLSVTTIEFVFGVIFNIILKKQVWDYSDRPFNLLGQVCPLFSVLWMLLSLVAVPLAGTLNKSLRGRV